MPEMLKGSWVTLEATVSEVLHPRPAFTYQLNLMSFEHKDPSPQLIPTSRRGGPAPKTEAPTHGRRITVHLTDIDPPDMDLKKGMQVRVRGFVDEVEGVGPGALLQVKVVDQMFRGPASEAVPIVE